jgi:hypothetical protein
LFDIFYYSWYFNWEGIAGNESGLVVTECIGIDERFLSIAEWGGVRVFQQDDAGSATYKHILNISFIKRWMS